MLNCSRGPYISWDEVAVTTEKGRREVHYYLRRGGGEADLAVVGREKAPGGRVSYRYAIKDDRLSLLKLRSRREVIHWLNSILNSVSGEQPNGSHLQVRGDKEANLGVDSIKDVVLQKMGQHMIEFMWLGSPWTCKKRRRHYQSFCRNGVTISVRDFVYVLAEEGKRLVAYLDDMYEDSRGNKLAVVQWFHKIDEVGFVLPRKYNDREIFFSLCLQDLSIECIDGLATVLCPEHYERFVSEATSMGLVPFVCYRQFDNDDVKPFDITQVKGYWKQGILRNISSSLPSDDYLKVGSVSNAVGSRPSKRIRWSNECDFYLPKSVAVGTTVQIDNDSLVDFKEGVRTASPKYDDALKTFIGSQIEVLSQDSGIRGCWFRAVIIKNYKSKVKVRYLDIKDAVDDEKYLEEWVVASRVAERDTLDIRVSGRTIVRPFRLSETGNSYAVTVGSIVDAWWYDGWWEGIVVKKESEENINVYFPGERQEMVFKSTDLRQSKEWIGGAWQNIKNRPDIVQKLSKLETYSRKNNPSVVKHEDIPVCDREVCIAPNSPQNVFKVGDSKMPHLSVVRDLLKDDLLAKLRWKTSGKRKRCRSPVQTADHRAVKTFEKLFINSTLMFEPDNCKYARDSQFNSPLTSMVMSR